MNRLPIRIAKLSIASACIVLTTWSVAVWMRKDPLLEDPVDHLQLFKNDRLRQDIVGKWPEFVRIASSDPRFQDVFKDFRRGAVFASVPARGLSEEKQAELNARLKLIYAKDDLTSQEEHALIKQASIEVNLLAPLMQFNNQLTQSGLADDEKYAATQLLLALMRDIAGGTASPTTLNKLIDEGDVFLRHESVKDDDIRRFVNILSSCGAESDSR